MPHLWRDSAFCWRGVGVRRFLRLRRRQKMHRFRPPLPEHAYGNPEGSVAVSREECEGKEMYAMLLSYIRWGLGRMKEKKNGVYGWFTCMCVLLWWSLYLSFSSFFVVIITEIVSTIVIAILPIIFITIIIIILLLVYLLHILYNDVAIIVRMIILMVSSFSSSSLSSSLISPQTWNCYRPRKIKTLLPCNPVTAYVSSSFLSSSDPFSPAPAPTPTPIPIPIPRLFRSHWCRCCVCWRRGARRCLC